MDYKIMSYDTKPNAGYMCDGIKLTNCEYLHKQGFLGEGMRVCVIDTGYTPHDFTIDNIIGGKNFTNEYTQDNYIDENSHGSFCIGEIVQIAPKCQVVVAKALGKSGNGTNDGIADAFEYAISQNVHVISMSLGGTSSSDRLHQLIKRANELGIIVICAAGNEGDGRAETTEVSYPADYEEVVNVGALNIDKSIARYSNSSQWVDVCCVGTDITSTVINNKWARSSGTSMSCPQVAGICLLLREKFIKEYGRNPSEQELYGRLIKNTEDLHMDRRFQGEGFVRIKED